MIITGEYQYQYDYEYCHCVTPSSSVSSYHVYMKHNVRLLISCQYGAYHDADCHSVSYSLGHSSVVRPSPVKRSWRRPSPN